MNQTTAEGTAFGISIGLAFIGGYADASSYLLASTFTGHLSGNCVLAAASAATKDWSLTLDRLLAVVAENALAKLYPWLRPFASVCV